MICGLNGAGKSTLGKEIARRWNVEDRQRTAVFFKRGRIRHVLFYNKNLVLGWITKTPLKWWVPSFWQCFFIFEHDEKNLRELSHLAFLLFLCFWLGFLFTLFCYFRNIHIGFTLWTDAFVVDQIRGPAYFFEHPSGDHFLVSVAHSKRAVSGNEDPVSARTILAQNHGMKEKTIAWFHRPLQEVVVRRHQKDVSFLI